MHNVIVKLLIFTVCKTVMVPKFGQIEIYASVLLVYLFIIPDRQFVQFQAFKLGSALIDHVPDHFLPYLQHSALSSACLGKQPSAHEKIQDLHYLHRVLVQNTAKLLYIRTVLHHGQIFQILILFLAETGKHPLQGSLRLRQKLKIFFCPHTDIFRHILQKPEISSGIFIDTAGGQFFRKLFFQCVHQIRPALLLCQMMQSHHPDP